MADSDKKLAIGGGLLLLLLLLTGAGGEPVPPTDPNPKPKPKPGGGGGIKPNEDPDQPKPKPGGTGDIPFKPYEGPVGPGGEEPDEPIDDGPDFDDVIKVYPTPGSFYQVVYGDRFGGQDDRAIAYRYLRTAGFLAAQEFGGLSDAEANTFGKAVANKASNRVKAIELIQCSGWNDVLYGTYGWGSDATPTSTGRAIRLVPQHSDVEQALRNRDRPVRNIAIGSPADKGKGNAYGVDPAERVGYELLWLPTIDLRKLWESSGSTIVSTAQWRDGTSKSLPPPWVQSLGITVPANVNVTKWGCGSGTYDMEED